jgi:hypothetical protein
MKTMKSAWCVAMLASAVYFTPVDAAAQVDVAQCKAASIQCGGSAEKAILVCALAAAEIGLNPIADIACGELASVSVAYQCVQMGRRCAKATKPQPAVVTKSIIGSASGTLTTISCPGSHRVIALQRLKNSAGATSRLSIKCTNNLFYSAGSIPAGDAVQKTTDCGAGRLVQGIAGALTNGLFTGFKTYCDYGVTLNGTDDDKTSSIGTGTVNDRMCTEGTYAVGLQATHSNGRLRGVSLLCRGLPK